MMRLLTLLFILMFLHISANGSAAADPNMRDGLWEITTTVDMPGMPAAMPPVKNTQCITKNDLIPKPQQKNQECSITDSKINGSTVTWSMKCNAEGSDMTGNGNITYTGETFDGVFNMNIQSPEQGGMKINQKMKGRRLGPCK